jgi:hypothetical protein
MAKYIAFINNKQVLQTVSTSELTNDGNYTIQGNTFNGASQLVQLTSASKLPAIDGSLLTNMTKDQVGLGNVANVDTTNADNITSGTLDSDLLSSDVTVQGNTFNGASQLVQLSSDSKLPAVNGSLLTGLTATQVGLGNVQNVDTTNADNITSGTLDSDLLDSDVTLQGNIFNGASQLVQLGTNGKLTALDGSLLTNMTKDQVGLGNVTNDAQLKASQLSTATDLGGGSASDELVPSQLAVKTYVDSVAQGLNVHAPVTLATVAVLPACTASGSGVGKTLTGDAFGKLTLDGVDAVVTKRVLVKNQAEEKDNGIYIVTATGAEDAYFVLTRASDFDGSPAGEVTDGDFFFVEGGNTLHDSGFVLTTPNTVTVDGSDLIFVQFSGAGQIVAGDAIDVTGATISVKVDDDTIHVNGSNQLEVLNIDATLVADGSISNTEFETLNGIDSNIQDQIDGLNEALGNGNFLTLPVSEALVAGNMVNIWVDGATTKVRKANATDDTKPAMGFVLESFPSGDAKVYLAGVNDSLASLTIGTLYYLSAASGGAVTATAPTATGNIIQEIGRAAAETTIDFSEKEFITVAA